MILFRRDKYTLEDVQKFKEIFQVPSFLLVCWISASTVEMTLCQSDQGSVDCQCVSSSLSVALTSDVSSRPGQLL